VVVWVGVFGGVGAAVQVRVGLPWILSERYHLVFPECMCECACAWECVFLVPGVWSLTLPLLCARVVVFVQDGCPHRLVHFPSATVPVASSLPHLSLTWLALGCHWYRVVSNDAVMYPIPHPSHPARTVQPPPPPTPHHPHSRRLNLAQNLLTGTFPSTTSQMSSLTALSLRCANGTSTHPPALPLVPLTPASMPVVVALLFSLLFSSSSA
jgi:hypothetical protein